jgi:hopanoid biosynthesis associated RND transporter like protein HpnN
MRFLSRLVAQCARHPVAVCLASLTLAVIAVWLAATHLAMTTDLDGLFSARLPWKQNEAALKRDFPQFNDLIVAVVDGKLPEEADATASALAAALAPDTTHFLSVRRPDSSAYLDREGLLFLTTPELTDLLDRTIDASPFLGQLAADPSARGLFSALSLIAEGLKRGQADLTSFQPALAGFHESLAAAAAGHARPLSWENLLAGPAATLAGPFRVVLIQARLDFGAVQPGGAATAVVRRAAAGLEFVRSGDAHVRLTGQVPLADEEFASAAKGAAIGLALSFLLVLLWLFLALRSWRLIAPVFLTLVLGLALTSGFAALAVGTLNLISVAFAILFVGIAVDFSIQFTVRFREMHFSVSDPVAALELTGKRVGIQVLIASAATSAGFLAFVPTAFRGVAELGLIAGAGMLIAFACTVTFLPAALALFRPRAELTEVGFAALAPIDSAMPRARLPILVFFLAVLLAGAGLGTRLTFDSNTLHTKPTHSEAMDALMRLLLDPVTNPFTVDILRPNEAAAQALAAPLAQLPLVDHTMSLQSYVPKDQAPKIAALQDAASILGPVIDPGTPRPAPDAADIRAAIQHCLAQLTPALAPLPANHELRAIADDLAALGHASDADLLAMNTALVRFLPQQIQRLRLALAAKPVTVADLPASITRDYTLADGRTRIQAVPKIAVVDSSLLRKFVTEVRGVAPDAGGPAVAIVSTADTITGAFVQAALSAILAIALILLIALRRLLDAALVLAPLLLSAAMTACVIVLAGMSLNFANIIALPLLLGVGVSFNIYYVMNWRAGEKALLASPTSSAVVFSALTTGTAFGSLALSAHPGTASMGTLLLISLGCTLAATLLFMPALLGWIGIRAGRD